jgi:hypothetical protein
VVGAWIGTCRGAPAGIVDQAQSLLAAALAQRYQCCVVPGCGVRFADCDIHHVWRWSLAGPTDLDLQVPVCSFHHIWLHEGGYTITREDAMLVFRDRYGRVIANLDHVLQRQLDLLPKPPPAAPERCETTDASCATWAPGPTAATDATAGAGPARTPVHHPATHPRGPPEEGHRRTVADDRPFGRTIAARAQGGEP